MRHVRPSRVARCLAPLLAAAVLVMCIPPPAQALTLQLHSTEFTFVPSRTAEQNIIDTTPAHCLIMELARRHSKAGTVHEPDAPGDKGVFWLVRFRMDSNISSVHRRSSLVVSVHPPDRLQASMIDPDRIISLTSFIPSEIEARVRAEEAKYQQLPTNAPRAASGERDPGAAAEAEQAGKRPRGATDGGEAAGRASAFDVVAAKTLAVVVRPHEESVQLTRGQDGSVVRTPLILEGSYGVCFSLEPPKMPKMPKDRPERVSRLPEMVEVDIVESVSSVSSTEGTYMLRSMAHQGRGAAGGAGERRLGARTLSDADRVYEADLRKIYGAGTQVGINELLARQRADLEAEMRELQRTGVAAGVPPAGGGGHLYSQTELVHFTKGLLNIQRMLFNVMESTTSSLESAERMRETAESTFTRIWVSCVCVVVAIAVSVWGTFTYARRIIVKKKLM